MGLRPFWLVLLAVGQFWAPRAFARDKRFTHYGVRPLAMGNAFTAVADDFNSLYYNPAGLNRIKEWRLEIINPKFEIASETLSAAQSISSTTGGSYDDTLSKLKEQVGVYHHFSFELNPNFVTKNFGFGLNANFDFNLDAHATIDADLGTGFDLIAPMGFASSFLEDRLALGAAVKFLAQGGVDDSFNLQTLVNLTDTETSKDLIKSGYGVGCDVGMLFTPFKAMEPTFGLSILDIGGSHYTAIKNSSVDLGAPPARLPSVNTGVSIKPYQTENSYILLAVDGQMLNQPIHYSHKLKLGLEYGYGEIIKFDTGLFDGYLTGGFQFDVGLLKVRFASYTVDHGPTVGLHPKLAEKRYAIQIKLLL